jgi:Amt family ammonium transporter
MYDVGSTAFMVVCTMLVLLMTPGLAFFYGGLSRRKNVVNTMIMAISVIGIVGVMWIACGWSFAYGGDGSIPFFGGFDQLGCLAATNEMLAEAADIPAGTTYPSIIDICFQMAFCMITCAIITGAVAGRMKYGAVLLFVAIWIPLVYAPLAHMVWGGDGSLIGSTIGALDFAGGDVVHISSGVTGLVLCILIGGRRGFGLMSYRAHNVPFVALGATLLWFGWFGFNAGSQFAADGVAALALLNTVSASAAGLLTWVVVERIRVRKPTLVGACTGLVAGLVGITPAAGFVEPWAAIIIGGDTVVESATFIATTFGMSETLIGLTIVAVGTSLPELVTSVVAARKNEVELSLGNAIGSNIFNILLILGLAGTISPLAFLTENLIDVIVLIAVSTIIGLVAWKKKKLGRLEGILMVAFYVAYVVYIALR